MFVINMDQRNFVLLDNYRHSDIACEFKFWDGKRQTKVSILLTQWAHKEFLPRNADFSQMNMITEKDRQYLCEA